MKTKWKMWVPLVIAILLGLVAARMAMKIVNSRPTVQSGASDMTSIVVAARDVPAGSTLTVEDLKTGRVDSKSIPTGAFTSVVEAIGRVPRVALSPNQAIVPAVLADEGAGFGMAATLDLGVRAITVAVDEISGVAGFITPLSRVDVVTTINIDGKSTAKTLLQSIKVLAVGTRTNPSQEATEPAKNVTLLVTPEQAEQIEVATNSGRVRLLLRNGRDNSSVNSDGTTVAELRDGQIRELTIEEAARSVPVGKRAITVGIDEVSGVSNFIQPNCEVDVIGTFENSGKRFSRAILEKVMVLAIGTRTAVRSDVEPGKTATLLVTPEQADKLAMLVGSGNLRLSLRNGDDEAELDNQGVTIADLTGSKSEPAFTVDPFGEGSTLPGTNASDTSVPNTKNGTPTDWTIEIIRGGEKSQQTFKIDAPRVRQPVQTGTSVTDLSPNQ